MNSPSCQAPQTTRSRPVATDGERVVGYTAVHAANGEMFLLLTVRESEQDGVPLRELRLVKTL